MRLLLLLLIVGVCIVCAKYLPDETINSEQLLSRHKRSDSDESIKSSEDEDISDDDDDLSDPNERKEQTKLQAKIENMRKKLQEKEEKEKQKKEEAQRKLEEKIATELRKAEEKRQKEERKREEKLQKERKKVEEEQRKIQEKIQKNEIKRQEKIQKQLEEIQKNTLKMHDGGENSSELNVNDSIELKDFWEKRIYAKYGITEANTSLERKETLRKYMEEELGLNINSTESERRQAVLQLVQNKLQNASEQNALQKELTKYINVMGVQKIRANLDKDIEELNNKTEILKNVNLPWVAIAQQNFAEQVSFLQIIKQYLSNILPNWFTDSTSTGEPQVNTASNTSTDSLVNSNTKTLNVNASSNASLDSNTLTLEVKPKINENTNEGNAFNLSSSSNPSEVTSFGTTNFDDTAIASTTVSDNTSTSSVAFDITNNSATVSPSSFTAESSSNDINNNPSPGTELPVPIHEAATISQIDNSSPAVESGVTSAPFITASSSVLIDVSSISDVFSSTSDVNLNNDASPVNVVDSFIHSATPSTDATKKTLSPVARGNTTESSDILIETQRTISERSNVSNSNIATESETTPLHAQISILVDKVQPKFESPNINQQSNESKISSNVLLVSTSKKSEVNRKQSVIKEITKPAMVVVPNVSANATSIASDTILNYNVSPSVISSSSPPSTNAPEVNQTLITSGNESSIVELVTQNLTTMVDNISTEATLRPFSSNDTQASVVIESSTVVDEVLPNFEASNIQQQATKSKTSSDVLLVDAKVDVKEEQRIITTTKKPEIAIVSTVTANDASVASDTVLIKNVSLTFTSSVLPSATNSTEATPSLVTRAINIESSDNPKETISTASVLSVYNSSAVVTQDFKTNVGSIVSVTETTPLTSSDTQITTVNEDVYGINQTSAVSEITVAVNKVQPNTETLSIEQATESPVTNSILLANTSDKAEASTEQSIIPKTIKPEKDVVPTFTQGNDLENLPIIVQETPILNVEVPVEQGASVIDIAKQ